MRVGDSLRVLQQQEQHDRYHEGQQHRAPVAEQTSDLDREEREIEAAERWNGSCAQALERVGRRGAQLTSPFPDAAVMDAAGSSPVSVRNASSRLCATISTSCAEVVVKRFRATASES